MRSPHSPRLPRSSRSRPSPHWRRTHKRRVRRVRYSQLHDAWWSCCIMDDIGYIMHDHGAVAAGRASAAAAVAAAAGAGAAATTTYGILCQLNVVCIYMYIYTGGSWLIPPLLCLIQSETYLLLWRTQWGSRHHHHAVPMDALPGVIYQFEAKSRPTLSVFLSIINWKWSQVVAAIIYQFKANVWLFTFQTPASHCAADHST